MTMSDKLKEFTVDFDLGFSFDVKVKARNGREAKKKAFLIFLNRHAKKMRNYNISWDCEDGQFGGQSALSMCGFR